MLKQKTSSKHTVIFVPFYANTDTDTTDSYSWINKELINPLRSVLKKEGLDGSKHTPHFYRLNCAVKGGIKSHKHLGSFIENLKSLNKLSEVLFVSLELHPTIHQNRPSFGKHFYQSLARFYGVSSYGVDNFIKMYDLDGEVLSALIKEFHYPETAKEDKVPQKPEGNSDYSRKGLYKDVLNKYLSTNIGCGKKQDILSEIYMNSRDVLNKHIRESIAKNSLAATPEELKQLVDLLFDLQQ